MKYALAFVFALCGVAEACPPAAVGQFNACPTNAPLVGAYTDPYAPPAVAFFVAPVQPQYTYTQQLNSGYNSATLLNVGHGHAAALRAAQLRAAHTQAFRAQSLRSQALRSQFHSQQFRAQFNAGGGAVTSEKIQRFGVFGQRRSVTERVTQ